MGAQRPERAREIAERYEQLKELQDSEQPPPFHYGSHYSSAAIVLYYMLRLEPFTTLAVRLQGGFFDHADRLFYSLGSTYHNATTSSADVKELLPDLFYNAELFHNANRLDLGTRQERGVLVRRVHGRADSHAHARRAHSHACMGCEPMYVD